MAATKNATQKSERRIAVRRQPTLGTVMRLGSGRSSRVGLVWNLSASGVSLLLQDAIKPGTLLRGELTTLDGLAALPVTFRVAHLSELRTGDYCVGGQFDEELSAIQMKPFLNTGALAKR